MNIVIIDYGAGNVQSVQFALERLGVKAILSNNAETISSADKIIFPGVGEAASAMHELRNQKLDELIPKLKQPVLGICLGMQLMCEHSEEGDAIGMNIFPLKVKRFTNEFKVPHMGWNNIYNLKGKLMNHIVENDFVYYVHSYYVEMSEWTIATTNYVLEYSGALHKDNFYACQFHPEKSSDVGEQILKNFLTL